MISLRYCCLSGYLLSARDNCLRGIIIFTMRTTLLSTVALTGLTHAFQYGYNQVPIQRDPDELAASFPVPGDDVKLYSPAFTQPESVPDTFEEGTDGPTDDGTMGAYTSTLLHLYLMRCCIVKGM